LVGEALGIFEDAIQAFTTQPRYKLGTFHYTYLVDRVSFLVPCSSLVNCKFDAKPTSLLPYEL